MPNDVPAGDGQGIHRAIVDCIRRLLAENRPHVDDVTVGFAEVARQIAGVDHVGVMLLTSHNAPRPAPALNGDCSVLDAMQAQLKEGPAIDAALHHETVREPDLAAAGRWPRFCDAVPEVRSVLSFQLYTHVQSLGALTLASERPHGLDDAEELGTILAAHAALTLDTVQRMRRHRSALGSRDLIGQAKGIFTERYEISPDGAFSLLTRIAAKANKPVVAIAKDIVEGTGGPEVEPVT